MPAKKSAARLEKADRKVSNRVNGERSSWPMRLIGAASDIGDQPQMRVLCVSVMALGLARGDGRLARTGAKMLAAHTLATWCKNRVKSVIDRARPDSGGDPKIRHGGSEAREETSFPSGHSAGIVAVAQAVARGYPDHATAARASAALVAAAQVPRGTHFAGDVIAGALIGLAAERASEGAIRAIAGGSRATA